MLDESTPIETTYHHLHYFKSLTKHIYYSYSQSACTETFEILKALKPLNYKTKKKKKKKKKNFNTEDAKKKKKKPFWKKTKSGFQCPSLLFSSKLVPFSFLKLKMKD